MAIPVRPKFGERLKSIFCIGSRPPCGASSTKPEHSKKDIHHPVPVSLHQSDSLPLAFKNLSQVSFKSADPITGSLFLSRLPLEIRREIYKYVLGNHKTIHLVRSSGKIVQSSSRKKLDHNGKSPWFEWDFEKTELALLRTCRQIYVETTDIVYRTNLFDFEEPAALVVFADRCLHPQRLAAIRHVRLQGKYSAFESDQAAWSQFWRVVSTRMNLTELQLCLESFCMDCVRKRNVDENWSMDATWVKPILEAKGIKACDIEIHACRWASKPQIDGLINDLRASLMAEK